MLSTSNYRRLKRLLATDVEAAGMIDLTPSIMGRTISTLEQAPLRTPDAIQVASALESMCDLFLTADRKQGEAAARLNLKTQLVTSEH